MRFSIDLLWERKHNSRNTKLHKKTFKSAKETFKLIKEAHDIYGDLQLSYRSVSMWLKN